MFSRLRLPTSRFWNCTIALRDHVRSILETTVGQRSIAASWATANLKTQNVTPKYANVMPKYVNASCLASGNCTFDKIGDCFIAGGPRSLILLPNHNANVMDPSDVRRSPIIISLSLSAYRDLLESERDEIESKIEDFTNVQDPYYKVKLYEELQEERKKRMEDEKYDQNSSGPIIWNVIN